MFPSPGGRGSVNNSPSLTESYAAALGPLIPSTVPENTKRVVQALENERAITRDLTNQIHISTQVLNNVSIRVENSGGVVETCRLAADTIVGLRNVLEQTQNQLESLTEELNRERQNVTTHSTNAFNSVIQMLRDEFRERGGLIEHYTAEPLPGDVAELTRILQDLCSELPPLAKQEVAGDHERAFLRDQLDKAASDRWQEKDAYEDNQQYLAGCLRDIASEAELELPWSIADPWPAERFVQVVSMLKETVRIKNQMCKAASAHSSVKQELETMRAAVMDICIISGLDPASPTALTVAVETVRLTRANLERMMISHNMPPNERKWDLAELGSQCRRLVEVSASQNQLLLNACNKLARLSVGRTTVAVPSIDKDSEAPVMRQWANAMETIVVGANPGGISALRAALVNMLLHLAPPETLISIGLPPNALTPPGGLEGFTDNALVESVSELLGRALQFARNAAEEIFDLKTNFGAERLATKERFAPMIRALRLKLDADRRSSVELRECDVRLGELERHLTTAALNALTNGEQSKREVSDMIGHMRNLVRRKISADAESERQFSNIYQNNNNSNNANQSASDPSFTNNNQINTMNNNNNNNQQQYGRQQQQQNDYAGINTSSSNQENQYNNSNNMSMPRW